MAHACQTRYRELRWFSCDLQRGDRVAVPGSNGSGKSALLEVLTGETEADAGTRPFGQGRQVRLV